MQPKIVKYTDTSSNSVFEVQKKCEVLSTYSKKRKFSFSSGASSESGIIKEKNWDKAKMRPFHILDCNLPEQPPKKKHEARPCTARKPDIDNVCNQPKLAWDFGPKTKKRAEWLFALVKPEDHYNPKAQPKKIPLSLGAALFRNALSSKNQDKVNDLEEKPNDYPKEKFETNNHEPIENEVLDYPQVINSGLNHDIQVEKPQSKASSNKNQIQENPQVQVKKEDKKKEAIDKMFKMPQTINPLYLSEYRGQYLDSNTAQNIASIKKEYNLK
ncbi:hypothetical protein SteCoe_8617 [Stentor coeruleus]|uniref:Uncharacterized protein n=1 Tax=Stentor coeruleus TaxID=5963 RepID=A0A1R2CJR5_9CILI|nr:hypothetical protein SteCoe_8617 [Stentor coeruleus]